MKKTPAFHADQAMRHFTRAAAILTEPIFTKNLAFALFEAALGMLSLAKADPSGEAHDQFKTWIENVQAEKREATQTDLEECGAHGCTRLKPKGAVFCRNCRREYEEDPDAFK